MPISYKPLCRLPSAKRMLWLSVALPAFAVVQPAIAQESPFAGDFAQEMNFATGDRLSPTYSEVGGSISLPMPRASMNAAAAAELGAAAEIQARLPANLTLGPGATSRISGDAAGQPRERSAAPAAAPARFVTLYQVNYDQIPLSKGSDYLAIVDEEGRLLHTRERSLPTAVDATTPTVTPEAAVMAARDDAGEAFAAEPQVGEPRLEVWVDSDLKGHLAWAIDMDAGSLTAPDARRYWVAAVGEPTVLNWESRIFHGHHGLVSGTLWTESALGATANQGLQDLEVVRDGPAAGMSTTASDGRYGFVGGTDPANLDRHAARPALGGREPGRPGPRGDQERRIRTTRST